MLFTNKNAFPIFLSIGLLVFINTSCGNLNKSNSQVPEENPQLASESYSNDLNPVTYDSEGETLGSKAKEVLSDANDNSSEDSLSETDNPKETDTSVPDETKDPETNNPEPEPEPPVENPEVVEEVIEPAPIELNIVSLDPGTPYKIIDYQTPNDGKAIDGTCDAYQNPSFGKVAKNLSFPSTGSDREPNNILAFGQRLNPKLCTTCIFHFGDDFKPGEKGTPVYSMGPGIVYSIQNPYKMGKGYYSYFDVTIIRHVLDKPTSGGDCIVYSRYLHIYADVEVGDLVHQEGEATPVGVLAPYPTNTTNNDHLHFEIIAGESQERKWTCNPRGGAGRGYLTYTFNAPVPETYGDFEVKPFANCDNNTFRYYNPTNFILERLQKEVP